MLSSIHGLLTKCSDRLRIANITDLVSADQISSTIDIGNFTIPHTNVKYENPILIFHKSDVGYSNLTHLDNVYISGEVHGNETVGAESAFAFAKYLCEQDPYDLEHMAIIITPMTNPIGYYHKLREEYNDSQLVDPNRDYPYNNEECFKTLVARVSFVLMDFFKPALVVTMHGGIQTFGWSWGSTNHADDYTTPDENLFEFIATKADRSLGWKGKRNAEYKMFGIINSGSIYAVDGTLEDFAYGIDAKLGHGTKIACNLGSGSGSGSEGLHNAYGQFKYANQTQYLTNDKNNVALAYLFETYQVKNPQNQLLGTEGKLLEYIKMIESDVLINEAIHSSLHEFPVIPAVGALNEICKNVFPSLRIVYKGIEAGKKIFSVRVSGFQQFQLESDSDVERSSNKLVVKSSEDQIILKLRELSHLNGNERSKYSLYKKKWTENQLYFYINTQDYNEYDINTSKTKYSVQLTR